MGRDDWCRRTTWSVADQADFQARLKRSRSDLARAQYLLLQAESLRATGDPALIVAAIALIDEMVARFPNEVLLAGAHLARAACLDALDRPAEAVESFRAAVVAQWLCPNVVTRVAMAFGRFCIRRDLDELLPEAEAYMNELVAPSPFPKDVFDASAVLALARAHAGDAAAARTFAERALDAARRTASDLPRHADLGLVEHVEPALLAKLQGMLARDVRPATPQGPRAPRRAADFLPALAVTPVRVAAIARAQKERDRLAAECATAEAALVAELRAVGLDVGSVRDLVTKRTPYPEAMPILLAHLPRPYPANVRDGIARALGVREARPAWATLARLFRDERDERVRDGIAVALAAAVSPELLGDLITLVRDPSLGPSRVLLLRPLARSADPRAHQALTALAADPDLELEVAHLLKQRARNQARRRGDAS